MSKKRKKSEEKRGRRPGKRQAAVLQQMAGDGLTMVIGRNKGIGAKRARLVSVAGEQVGDDLSIGLAESLVYSPWVSFIGYTGEYRHEQYTVARGALGGDA